jgi:hypothetical protein
MLCTLYLDETGHPADHAKLHVGLAGFVAPVQSSELLGFQWIDVLEQFGIGEPFHMMDFASRRNAYKKWTETKRKKLLAALVDLVVATPGVKPLGVMVCMPAYREIPEVEQLRLRNPYLVALENCIRTSVFGSIAEMEATRGELVPRIQIVLARNEGYSGKGADLWGWMRQFDALGVTGMFMDSIKIGTPNEHAALQVADLIAYESGKFFNYTLPHGMEPRWAYKRIFSSPKSSLKHLGKQELQSSLHASGTTAEGLDYFRL